MRALIQRVSDASVSVDGAQIAGIDAGLLILVCAMPGDSGDTASALALKISKLRVFQDAEGKMNLSLVQTGGAALVVSQFTLAADTSRGNRPGFAGAADPEQGKVVYEAFATHLGNLGITVETGRFGADMAVRLTNDGPVTIWMDTDAP
ncbi:D-tyrosyl-tRNA(Tyr) deacylase [Sulfitobacter sp. SK012]|uniref:D-aminoacyl-tRNA deacylase n=1 Tax=Sulfitobacter sp. SK012 TaxID=1389005 RepID=UPI000E0BAC6C|nr:D-aminoacyl-tRNA deacylase [Sulfitobacter sp. SK012]AXI47513.1 D-tyrosyl-tRNA(Tyr) deacylase [Sulfitobacter sp. SK012]